MSKKNCARFIVVIASILMLAVAPMTFAADGSGSVTVESLLDSLVDAIGDILGGDSPDENGGSEETEDEDGGVPDLSTAIDPIG
ncbi:MAG: hypothetical protein AAFX50_05710 [Acidobacteriota bacterium]